MVVHCTCNLQIQCIKVVLFNHKLVFHIPGTSYTTHRFRIINWELGRKISASSNQYITNQQSWGNISNSVRDRPFLSLTRRTRHLSILNLNQQRWVLTRRMLKAVEPIIHNTQLLWYLSWTYGYIYLPQAHPLSIRNKAPLPADVDYPSPLKRFCYKMQASHCHDPLY